MTDICSDKTDTLIHGKMIARIAWVPGLGTIMVKNSNKAFNPTAGEIQFDSRTSLDIDFKKVEEGSASSGSIVPPAGLLQDGGSQHEDLLALASLANLTTVYERDGTWHARGDPTEIVIQDFAARFSWNGPLACVRQTSFVMHENLLKLIVHPPRSVLE